MADLSAIFKAYDVRGRVGSELTQQAVEAIGVAFGQWLPENGVVSVGYDMRPDSKQLADAMIAGLTAAGRDVWDIGQVTSDMIYFTVGRYGFAGGAMITASHNPGDYNGIKFCREDAKPVGEESGLKEIQQSAEGFVGKIPQAATAKSVTLKNVTEDWLAHVQKFIKGTKLKPFHIAVDAGNGMAGTIFAELEPYIPLDVEEMYFEPDGTFPNHIANPLEPKNLEDLIQRIKKDKLDFGIAFDGDGDRAVMVDEHGEPLSGTVMTAILAEYFLRKVPGATVLHNAICGRAAVEAITRNGGKPIRTKVGHSFIKSDMRQYDAVFAGEHSGHYYFKDNYYADSGLIAAIIVVAVLSDSGKTLSELAAPFRTYAQLTETNFEVADKQGTMERVAAAFPDAEQDWLDGLTLNFADGAWLNVRPSNTEPLLRLNAEASNKERLNELQGKMLEILGKH